MSYNLFSIYSCHNNGITMGRTKKEHDSFAVEKSLMLLLCID